MGQKVAKSRYLASLHGWGRIGSGGEDSRAARVDGGVAHGFCGKFFFTQGLEPRGIQHWVNEKWTSGRCGYCPPLGGEMSL